MLLIPALLRVSAAEPQPGTPAKTNRFDFAVLQSSDDGLVLNRIVITDKGKYGFSTPGAWRTGSDPEERSVFFRGIDGQHNLTLTMIFKDNLGPQRPPAAVQVLKEFQAAFPDARLLEMDALSGFGQTCPVFNFVLDSSNRPYTLRVVRANVPTGIVEVQLLGREDEIQFGYDALKRFLLSCCFVPPEGELRMRILKPE